MKIILLENRTLPVPKEMVDKLTDTYRAAYIKLVVDFIQQELSKVSESHLSAKYRKLFENMDLGMLEVDLKERIVFVNKGFEKTTGYTDDELRGQIASDVLLKRKERIKN